MGAAMAERSFTQRLILSMSSSETAAAMEAESRAWFARCESCGTERSVWEMGGIRAGAAGNPRWRVRCAQCREPRWHDLRYTGDSMTPHRAAPNVVRLVLFTVAVAALLAALTVVAVLAVT